LRWAIVLAAIAAGAGSAHAEAAADAGIGAPSALASPSAVRVYPLALQLDVSVNGRRLDVIGSFRQLSDGKLVARVDELASLGVEASGHGDDWVSLASIPGLAYVYDEPKQAIALTAEPRCLLPRRISVARRAAVGHIEPEADWGALLNYSVFASAAQNDPRAYGAFDGLSATLEGRLFSPLGLAEQTGVVGRTTTANGPGVRLDSTLSHEDGGRLIDYRVGDAVSAGLVWTRPVRFGGFQIDRNFGLRSDLVTAPLPVLSGTAAVPSTLDVFVNEQKIYAADVDSGRFLVTDLPVVSGSGDTRMVMRDASGREVETDARFYVTPDMLRAGLYDFSVEAGAPRIGYGVDSFAYQRQPFGSWTLRDGLTDIVTLQNHGEVSNGFANVGVGAVVSTFGLAAVTAAFAASRNDCADGGQLYLGAQTRFLGLTLQASAQQTFRDYEDIASVSASADYLKRLEQLDLSEGLSAAMVASLADAHAPRRLYQATLGFPLPIANSSLGLTYVDLAPASGPPTQAIGLTWSKTFDFGGAASLSAYVNVGSTRSVGVFGGFSMPLGPLGYGSVGGSSSGGDSGATFSLSKPLGDAPGSFGWQVQDQESPAYNRTAEGSYRSGYGAYIGRVTQSSAGVGGSVEADGAIVATRDGVFASNRVDDAFAVVSAGAPNVDVTVENKRVGQTDSRGMLLVPNMHSLQSNHVAIDATQLPVDALPARTQAVVAPMALSGARVDFGVDVKTPAAELVLVDATGAYLAPGSHGVLASGARFVVGYDGEAFVTGLRENDSAVVTTDKATCRAEFSFRRLPGRRVRIGPVVCRPAQ
jgi:outer membrane usher protein